jgi:hypothetical protein
MNGGFGGDILDTDAIVIRVVFVGGNFAVHDTGKNRIF